MRKKEKIWIYLAVHEAAHAICAIHLEVPFHYVTVTPSAKIYGGQLRLKRMHKRRTRLQLVTNHLNTIIVLFAPSEFFREKVTDGDAADIKHLADLLQLDKSQIKALQRESRKIMSRVFVREAVARVAGCLHKKKTLTPAVVREHYRAAKMRKSCDGPSIRLG